MKLTINRKMLIIYFFMALLAVLSSTYAVLSLYRINQAAVNVANNDFSFLDASKQISNILLGLENADKEYLILKDSSSEAVYWARTKELKTILTQIKSASAEIKKLLDDMAILSQRHGEIFRKEVLLIAEASNKEAFLHIHKDRNKIMDEMTQLVQRLQETAEKEIGQGLHQINSQSQRAARITMILSAISLVVGFVLALIITYNISWPLIQLKRATTAISEGQFDYPVDIVRRDEIGSLAKALRTMKDRLKILEAKLRDESPLTGLPGNRAIEEIIEKQFLEGNAFSLCHLDLDNFKPYVDKYGYAWGSEILKEVADILKEKLFSSSHENCFIGHIGGDDFIIIADPDTAEVMSHDVIQEFDRRIIKFFTQNDREKEFIVGRDRHGIFRKFPLVSLSIAIVTHNNTNQFESALDMAQKAAELKEHVKTFAGSNVRKMEEIENG